MLENFEVKIVRLTTGEDIIGFIFVDELEYIIHVKYPKAFYFNLDTDSLEEELILVDWLPQPAYYSQEVSFSKENVLFISDCNIDFGYEYLNLIQSSMELEETLVDKINETILEFIPSKGNTIH